LDFALDLGFNLSCDPYSETLSVLLFLFAYDSSAMLVVLLNNGFSMLSAYNGSAAAHCGLSL
jgi:hypothetical protein